MHETRLTPGQILRLLSTPFDCSEAYEMGSIDSQGTPTGVKSSGYSRSHRIVLNVKRVLESRFRCSGRDFLLAGLCVINEELASDVSYSTREIETSLDSVIAAICMGNESLEEAVEVGHYVDEDGEGAAIAAGDPTNNTAGVANPVLPITKQVGKRKLPPDVVKLKDIEEPDDDTIDS